MSYIPHGLILGPLLLLSTQMIYQDPFEAPHVCYLQMIHISGKYITELHKLVNQNGASELSLNISKTHRAQISIIPSSVTEREMITER